MGAPKKIADKNIPKNTEADDDDDDLETMPKKKVVDEDEDFDGPLDDLGFDEFGEDDDDEDF
ncbi:hypothetical protein [Mucilaginibacter antarcticus]|uniref:Uncharacterized protein n=1 Tax=Mucilaginibacter antarcticus TaxID=1855725 RepID=A0ABW5XV18_9SPHI